MSTTLGVYMRVKREQKGLSARSLCAQLGLSPSALTHHENGLRGRTRRDAKMLVKWAELVGADAGDVLLMASKESCGIQVKGIDRPTARAIARCLR